eukprot:g12756.t1
MAGATLTLSYLKLVGGNDTTTAPEDNKGGAILVESGALNLLSVVISKNYAYAGGAIYGSGKLHMTNTKIHDNHAIVGGGIYLSKYEEVNITKSIISYNSATSYGGIAIAPEPYCEQKGGYEHVQCVAMLFDTKISNNIAKKVAAGIAVGTSTSLSDKVVLSMRNCSVKDNVMTATSPCTFPIYDEWHSSYRNVPCGGGGLSMFIPSIAMITDSSFDANKAFNHQGNEIFTYGKPTLILVNTQFANSKYQKHNFVGDGKWMTCEDTIPNRICKQYYDGETCSEVSKESVKYGMFCGPRKWVDPLLPNDSSGSTKNINNGPWWQWNGIHILYIAGAVVLVAASIAIMYKYKKRKDLFNDERRDSLVEMSDSVNKYELLGGCDNELGNED